MNHGARSAAFVAVLGFFLLCFAAWPRVYAQGPSVQAACVGALDGRCKILPVARLNDAPTIDGILTDDEWETARRLSDFHQVIPNEFDPTNERTTVFVGYDADFLYVAARMESTRPERIVNRRLIQGGGLGGEDRFRLVLAPLNNGRTGYVFETNPNGVRREGLIEGPNDFNFSWRAIWQVRARRTETGWEAEMAVPFKSINFNPANPNWGIGFQREIGYSGEVTAWTSQDRRVNTEALGVITGLEGAQQGVGLDLIPNFNVRADHDDETGKDSFSIEPGLDVIYNITPTLKASLTVNTDFSTTDVDDQVVNLSRFSIFLPERRDFFLQDADIFRFGNISRNGSPFFSRRIGLDENAGAVDLKFGGKLTGRIGDVSIGILDVVQEKGGIDEDGNPRGGDANLFVGRATVDVLENSTIGLVATHGDPLTGESANTIGADFLWRDTSIIPGRRINGEFWWQRSSRPGDDPSSGGRMAWGAFLSFPSREGLRGFVNYRVLQSNFDPALGFVNRPGINEFAIFSAYDHRPKRGPFRRINAEIFAERFEDRTRGEVSSEFVNLRPVTLIWQAGDRAQLDLRRTREVLFEPFEIVDGVVIPVGDYSWNAVRILFETAPQRKLSVDGSVEYGDFYTGTRLRWNGVLNWRPSKNLRLRLSYRQNSIDLENGDFTTRIVTFRSDIAFNSQWSWISRLQFDNVSDSGSLNSRLRYEVQPGRDLFLVFNQGFVRDEFADRPSRFDLTDRDLTFRIAYTFRF